MSPAVSGGGPDPDAELADAEQALYVALCVDDTLSPAVRAAYERVAVARAAAAPLSPEETPEHG